MRHLNRTLPRDRYLAYNNIHLGAQVEADVAEFELLSADGTTDDSGGGVATLSETEVEVAVATLPATFPDYAEVQVVDRTESNRLVGVIEIVSPGNKKEADEREAFVDKCSAHLQLGIGLVIIDVVTSRRANLHNDLARRLGATGPPALLPDEPLYVAGYRPVRRAGKNLLDLWPKAVHLGQPLPPIPLPLKGGPAVRLDLDGTYTEAVADSGL